MDERRYVHRRQSIFTELDDGSVFEASPLPWQARNDLGDEIMRQNAEAVNSFVKLYVDPDTGTPQMEARLDNTLIDHKRVLGMAYPEAKPEDFDGCSWEEMIELIFASLEVNQLEKLKRLVDPNLASSSQSNGGLNTDETRALVEELLGQKTESSADSESSDSPETTSSASPTEKSSVS